MKLKKIIAREFLFLLTTAVLIGLTFIGLKIYNASKEKKRESFKTEAKLVENKYQSFLSQPLKVKDIILNQTCLDRLIEFYKTNSEVESYNVIYKKFPELKGDSTLLYASFEYKATINSDKYKSLKEVNLKFPEFFIINQTDIDSLNNYKSQIELLQSNISKYDKGIYAKTEILELLYLFSIWLIIILFGLRYLYYSTKWALRTIKTKE